MLKRAAALALCVALLTPLALADAPFMGGGHNYIRSHTYTPAALTQYTVNTLRHTTAGIEEEHILSFMPNSNLRPVAVASDTIYNGGLTLSQAAAKLQAQGYDVVGGMNGTFFSTNMMPIGLQMHDGVLTSLDHEGLPSIGFTDDGSVIFGVPLFSISVTSGNGSVTIDRLNKTRNVDRVYLYTRDFSETTRTNKDGTHVVINTAGKLTPGASLTGTVTKILNGTAAYTLAEEEMVLSASSQSAIDRLAFLTVGSTVTINVRCADERWNNVTSAVGGLRYLVKDGIGTSDSDGERKPRSAAGVTADGTVILYSVDGRQPGYSSGMTLKELTGRLIDMGCVTAIELDGGGSAAFSVRMPGETTSKIANKPSDPGNTLRKGPDHIILCNVAPKTDGTAALLFPKTDYITMMPNAEVNFSLLATDEAYRPAALPAEPVTAGVENPLLGTVSGTTFYSLYPGDTLINFHSGGATGSARVSIAARIDAVALLDAQTGLATSELIVAPGQSVMLTAKASLNGVEVISSPRSFFWSVEGDIGTVTPDGLFVSGTEKGKTGRIIVTGGGQTAILPVTVGAEPVIIEDFENDTVILSGGTGKLAVTSDQNRVERGTKAAAFAYQFTQTAPSPCTLTSSYALAGYPSGLHVLVTGDGSGHELFASVTTADGAVVQVSLGKLDFTGVKMLSAPLPDRAVIFSGLSISPLAEGRLKGTLYLHFIAVSWSEMLADAPPSVKIEWVGDEGEERVYIVTATDASGNFVNDILVSWDGEKIEDIIWDIHICTATVRVPLPYDGWHILSVNAVDSFGQRIRVISSDYLRRRESLSSIYDASDSVWSVGYVDFLDDRGILDTEIISDQRYFYPTRPIPRMEAIRMMVRALGIELTSDTVLPFTDISGLSEEDLAYARAVYDAGLIMGKTSGNDLILDPEGELTRSELFVILYRTLPHGYAVTELTAFHDAATVPAYALRATQTLVNMGVVKGSDGGINPLSPVTRDEVASLLCRLLY